MPDLRISGGSLRGRRINVPPADVRPTSERARQAFFNIVAGRIAGARFLDLFAGSGIFAFEAVSRGAASATAVDSSAKNTTAIAQLAAEWSATVSTVNVDVFRFLSQKQQPFDVIYADPPYDFGRYPDLLDALARSSAAGAQSLIAIEHRRRTELPEMAGRLRQTRRAEYGEVWIAFYA